MIPTTSLQMAILLLEALPGLITASAEVVSLINSTAASLRRMQDEERDPTDAEWEALHGVLDTLRRRIDKDPA